MKLSKSDQVRTFATVVHTCSVGNETIAMDPNSLFHRLIVMAERCGDIRGCFAYETPYPMSLFKHGYMRKPNKPALYTKFAAGLTNEDLPCPVRYVVDGGCLLHKVRWSRGSTIDAVMYMYVSYVVSRFGTSVVVVFDGYDSPSVKDHEHSRRAGKVAKSCPDVVFDGNTPVTFEQDGFLANLSNKKHLIRLLMQYLAGSQIGVQQSAGDADTDIVSVALELASIGSLPIAVFADDTDILALLIYHVRPNMSAVFFVSDARMRSKKDSKTIKVQSVQDNIGTDACQVILAAHAFGGCDTTSAVFGFGKGSVLSAFISNSAIRGDIAILQSHCASVDAVSAAGINLTVAMYSGLPNQTLSDLRYQAFCKSALGRKFQAERLPPTTNAAHFHSLRAHMQIVTWESLGSIHLDPTVWGWLHKNDSFSPVVMTSAVAPDGLLKFVRCSCKSDCKSAHCTCRKHGVKCVAACKSCHGLDCLNADEMTQVLSDTESDTDSDPESGSCLDADSGMFTSVLMDDDVDWEMEETVIS